MRDNAQNTRGPAQAETRPELEEQAGSLVVRFLPTAYVPPSRVDHDLSGLQRDLLAALARLGEASLPRILTDTPGSVAARTARDNLSMLCGFGLVDLLARGRGARWRLRRYVTTHKTGLESSRQSRHSAQFAAFREGLADLSLTYDRLAACLGAACYDVYQNDVAYWWRWAQWSSRGIVLTD